MAEGLTVLEAILLGLLQGVTEWLPVSSSGHLVIAQQLFGLQATLFFDVLVHVGTLGVVLVFYRERVGRILASVPGVATAVRAQGWQAAMLGHPDRRLATMVVLGTVPTVAIGFGFRTQLEGAFGSLVVVGVALLATGTWLMLSRTAPLGPGRTKLVWQDALLIGLLQGVAIVPGVSRSGATIGAALLVGVAREEAVEYSFLLSVPAILGATILQVDRAAIAGVNAALAAHLAGMLAAVLVGYAALWLLVQLVRRRVFHQFSWYCWTVGAVVLYLAV